ncbi:type II toxin-antitoxin system VapC family toxin [Nitrospira moscoviensis]|uniref:Toxin-antitoxin system, toxin component, PIN family n=1 Tax=Nitrospira moscoviensis TaxID=42253 RepID=A0A0K2GBK9_NITMO|nr:type II toxin-antitoxin system VapC family toxin [Nitrospira moscoviensis]ALA57967.1 Toxin-antitoxin system, toxin component, PIN family [Nitrospira moscoviensis]
MILYLDTSAVVKLYVEERLSAELQNAVGEAEAVATSLLAYAETRAAFARARRDMRLPSHAYQRVVGAFEEDWPRYLVVEVTDHLVKRAGELAELRALRGSDALHLASALVLRERVSSTVMFLAFDLELTRAAQRERLPRHPLST